MLNIHKTRIIRLVVALFGALILSVMPGVVASAQEYGCNTYGSGEYGQNVCAAATDEDGDDGSLVDTGQALSLLIPALLILGGTVLMYRTRKRTKARWSDRA